MKLIRWLVTGFTIGVFSSVAPSCSPAAAPCANCAGCCNAGTCQDGRSVSACGTSGAACSTCMANQACVTGACRIPDGGTGGGVGGTGGGSTGPAAVGDPCTGSTQCAALGAGAKCKLTTTRTDGTYAGGLCTVNCTGAGQGTCPGVGTRCSEEFGLDLYGEYESVCLAGCAAPDTQSSCRSGYGCYGPTGGTGACWIAPQPAFDGGTPPNKLGYACALDSTCQNPPLPLFGFCIPQSLAQPDGGTLQSYFAGGYCSSDCVFGSTRATGCGPTGVCVDLGTATSSFNTCLGTCATPGSGKLARPGGGAAPYSCYAYLTGGVTFGVVFPSCDAVNNNCAFAPGSTCNTTRGFCCFTDGGCLNAL